MSHDVLSPDALAFVDRLHRELNPERERLLAAREARRGAPTFVRAPEDFTVAPAPADLQDRRVEITGPVDRKMMINALNSGAKVFMADFEDANSPTWDNVRAGQQNVYDAVRRQIELDTADKSYRLNDETATLVIRNRGWHMVERHHEVDGAPVSASLFDFGLTVFNNAHEQLARGTGPYFYLPKLESHEEARLWARAFRIAEDELGLAHGSIKCTVLIETILAAYEMDAILYELREHSCALNAGRWDYIFSCIKKLGAVLPDRAQVTMTVPFMRSYTELLVQTCHNREAHAIGGMAAFIPSRRDPEVNAVALAKVSEDKRREAGDGFDGTWVAHPDLVPTAMAEFDAVLGDRANQVERKRDDVHVTEEALRDFDVPGGEVTDDGPARQRERRRPLHRRVAAGRRRGGDRQPDGGRGDRRDLARAGVVVGAVRAGSTTSACGNEVAAVDASDAAKDVFLDVALSVPLKDFLTLAAYDRLA